MWLHSFTAPRRHQRIKFRKDRSNRRGDIAIYVIFKMAGATILDVQKLEILTVEPGTRVRGQCASPVIKIGQMVGEIWRFKRFSKWQNCGSPPSGIFEIHFLTIGAVKRPIVHHRINKFRKGRSNCCGDIKISVIFQDGGRHHHGFFKNI